MGAMSIGGATTCQLYEKRHGVKLKGERQFTVWLSLEVGIKKYSRSFYENLVNIGNKSSTVSQLETTLFKFLHIG